MADIKHHNKLGRPLRVGVMLTNSKTEILDVAPIDVFSGISTEFVKNFPDHMLTDRMREEALNVDFHWVNESGQTARLTAGAPVQPTHTFDNCPPLDVLLMGAHEVNYHLSEGEIKFLQRCNEESAALLFICGGFLCALEAGLLKGKKATAPRPLVEPMRMAHPEVDWVTKRYVNDGKIWTSGALLNGTDMVREFVTQLWGGEGSLVEFGMRLGAFPDRDVDYKDVPWVL